VNTFVVVMLLLLLFLTLNYYNQHIPALFRLFCTADTLE